MALKFSYRSNEKYIRNSFFRELNLCNKYIKNKKINAVGFELEVQIIS